MTEAWHPLTKISIVKMNSIWKQFDKLRKLGMIEKETQPEELEKEDDLKKDLVMVVIAVIAIILLIMGTIWYYISLL